MEVSFVKEGTKYVGTFNATGDFNLHIEKNSKSFLYILQRTSSKGQYASLREASFSNAEEIIEFDYSASVYPKSIKIECSAEPIMCDVTFA